MAEIRRVDTGEVQVDRGGFATTMFSGYNPLYVDWVADSEGGLLIPFVTDRHLKRFHINSLVFNEEHSTPEPPKPLDHLFGGRHHIHGLGGHIDRMREGSLTDEEVEDLFTYVPSTYFPRADRVVEIHEGLVEGRINYHGIGRTSMLYLEDFIDNGLFADPGERLLIEEPTLVSS